MSSTAPTTLIKKLDIKPHDSVCVIPVDKKFQTIIGELPNGAQYEDISAAPLAVLIFFTTNKRELENEFVLLKQSIAPNGMLWIAWPKKSSNVPADLDENQIRAIGLQHGLVDVKVCAINETWSGLKFVLRAKDR
jgi:hypothetical protein